MGTRSLLMLGCVFMAGAKLYADSQWYTTTVHPTPISDVCATDMEIDSRGYPVIAFVQEGGCPGPYVADWLEDHWGITRVSTHCLTALTCEGTAIDLSLNTADQPRITLGTALPNAQYFKRSPQGWEGTTLSTFAIPIALTVDSNDEPRVLFRSYPHADPGENKSFYYGEKQGNQWSYSFLVKDTHEAKQTVIAVDPSGAVYIALVWNHTPNLFSRINNVFQRYIVGSTPDPVAVALDEDNNLWVAFTNQGGDLLIYQPKGGINYSVPGFITIFSLDNFKWTLTGDGRFRLLTVLIDGGTKLLEWNGVSFSTDTTFFGLGLDIRGATHLREIRGCPVLAGHDYKQNDNANIYLRMAAKLPPPLELNVSSRTTASVQWSWPAASLSMSGFRVRRAGDNADLSGLLPASATSWTGVFPSNRAVDVFLETIYPGFVLPSPAVTGYTRAFPPESVRLARSDTGGLYAAWSANGNPAPTSYRLAFHAPNGTVLTATAGTPSYEYPLLSPLVPYGLGLATLGADGTELAMSSVTAVTTVPGQTRMVFDVGELTVETVLSPAEGFGNPVLAAGPASAFPANTTAGTAATGRGFQVEMDRVLPRGQSAMVSVVYPAGWLDSAPGGPRVLARYDAARAEWVMLPTGQEGRRLTARADGFGTFQVMVRTETTYDTANVKAYPNPFQAGGEERLVVRDVPPGGRVRVMTLKGGLVRTLSGTETGFVEWDGCDSDGILVKSGVYLFLVDGAEGTKKMKIILER